MTTSVEITSENEISPSYDDEITKLKEYRTDLDELFTDEKTKLTDYRDQMKRQQMRGGLTYVSTQVSNLVSIKTASIAITKAIIDTKSKKFNETFKIESKQDGSKNGAIPSSVRQLIDETITKNQSLTETPANMIDQVGIPSDSELHIVIDFNETPVFFALVSNNEIKMIDEKPIVNIKLNIESGYCLDENDECFPVFRLPLETTEEDENLSWNPD